MSKMSELSSEQLRRSIDAWAEREKARIRLRADFLNCIDYTFSGARQLLALSMTNECVEELERLFDSVAGTT